MPAAANFFRRGAIATTCLLIIASALTASSLTAQQVKTFLISPRPISLGDADNELFESIQFGRLSPDGRAVVADGGGLFVRVYGPDGKRQASFGRKGGGPGEFSSIHGLWLTREGKIGLWDGSSRRLTAFEWDGRVAATSVVRPEGKMTGNLEIFMGALRTGDVLLGALNLKREPGVEITPERWTIGRFSSAGEFREAAGEVRGMYRMRRSPLPFTPVPRYGVRGDSLWVVDGFDPELKALSLRGDVLKRIDLPWRVQPPADQRAVLEPRLTEKKKQFQLELLNEAPTPERVPAAAGMLVDDLGYLWIKEYDPNYDSLWLHGAAFVVPPGGTWHILSPEGRWAILRMPRNLTPLDIRGNKLLAVARDEFDVEQVVVHTISR